MREVTAYLVSPTTALTLLQIKCESGCAYNRAELCELRRGEGPRNQADAKNGLWQSKFDRPY